MNASEVTLGNRQVPESRMAGVSSEIGPPVVRDCVDCGAKEGMRLQNVARTQTTHVPLFYICVSCGSTMTIPPPRSPLDPR